MDKRELKEQVEDYLAIEGVHDARIALEAVLQYIEELDEPEAVDCAENERTTEIVEVPQMIGAYIKKERVKNTLGNIADEIYNSEESWSNLSEEYKWMRLNFTLFSRAWLNGYTIEPPKTLQVIVKNYDSTVYKTELPEDEAMKLIEGWKK